MREHDLELGLLFRRQGDPAEALVGDLAAHLEAEGVSVEHESRIRIVGEHVHVAE